LAAKNFVATNTQWKEFSVSRKVTEEIVRIQQEFPA